MTIKSPLTDTKSQLSQSDSSISEGTVDPCLDMDHILSFTKYGPRRHTNCPTYHII